MFVAGVERRGVNHEKGREMLMMHHGAGGKCLTKGSSLILCPAAIDRVFSPLLPCFVMIRACLNWAARADGSDSRHDKPGEEDATRLYTVGG